MAGIKTVVDAAGNRKNVAAKDVKDRLVAVTNQDTSGDGWVDESDEDEE